jgi:UDP-glucuronate 4-epimerase
MMRFLVTGGAGFIGSHLCEALVRQGNDVVCVDNFDPYLYPASVKRLNIKALRQETRFQLIEASICEEEPLESLFSDGHFDGVVHLAARAGVRPSIKDPRSYQRVNVEGTLNLLEFSRRYGVSKFVMASSSSVYGNNKKVPFSEDDCVDYPISPYAATKKACELIGYTYASLYSLPVTCLRFFTVYGPRQRPEMAIYKFTRLISRGEEIPVFGDGTTQRDYTYITDIMDGLLKAIERCEGYHVYNLGESCTVSLSRLIELIEKALGKKARIKSLPMQPGDVRVTYADIQRAKKDLGYAPIVSIEEGIPAFVRWYQKNRESE